MHLAARLHSRQVDPRRSASDMAGPDQDIRRVVDRFFRD
jgi:hypothetical protein